MNKPHANVGKEAGDLVLQEVRRIKETLGDEYDHDIEKLFEILKEHEKQSKHPVAELKPLKPKR